MTIPITNLIINYVCVILFIYFVKQFRTSATILKSNGFIRLENFDTSRFGSAVQRPVFARSGTGEVIRVKSSTSLNLQRLAVILCGWRADQDQSH